MKGTIVSVITIQDEQKCKEASFVQKIEYPCECNNCIRFETYVIFDKQKVNKFCVTESYLVVIIDNAVKFMPLDSTNVKSFTRLWEFEEIDKIQFTLII